MVTLDEVRRIARLARIHLDDGELENVRQKFSSILDHFRSLNDVDTTGVEPQFYAAEAMSLRPDEPEAPIAVDALMKNAPESVENGFRIPRVVGGEE